MQGGAVCGRQGGGQPGPAAAVAAVQGQVGLNGRRAGAAGVVRDQLAPLPSGRIRARAQKEH